MMTYNVLEAGVKVPISLYCAVTIYNSLDVKVWIPANLYYIVTMIYNMLEVDVNCSNSSKERKRSMNKTKYEWKHTSKNPAQDWVPMWVNIMKQTRQ